MPRAHRDDRQQGDARGAAQNARGVGGLSGHLLDGIGGAAFGDLLASRFDGADLEPGLPSRLGLGQPGFDLSRHEHVDVVRQFLGRLAVEPVATRQFQQPTPESSHGGYSESACSTRSIAAMFRSHAFWPDESLRRPLAVSV